VRDVAREIGKHIDKPTVVVTKSTVPVGTGNLVEEIIRAQGVDNDLFDVVSNPEFLREGSAIEDTLEPDRIVIGASNPAAAAKLVELYEPLGVQPMVTNLNSAELIKYASNSFLALKISFINAIGQICERCEADVVDVARGMGLDKRIGLQFLNAGLGWGGSCFPKDVQGLLTTAQGMGYDFRLLEEVINVNTAQTELFVHRMADRLGGLRGKTIAMLGLAFKPNTDDVRDAKSLVLIRHILDQGGHVRAYDPVAAENARREIDAIELVDSPYEVARDADAVVVVTEWNEFKQMDLTRLAEGMKQRILFDGRRIWSRANAQKAGFEYYTIGLRA
jgi:UDPglucose 6-dehydrogenase